METARPLSGLAAKGLSSRNVELAVTSWKPQQIGSYCMRVEAVFSSVGISQKAEIAIYLWIGLIYSDSLAEENLHTGQIRKTAIREYTMLNGCTSLQWKFVSWFRFIGNV